MKIKMLATGSQYNLNDYEKLFFFFMGFLQNKRATKDVRFYMYSDDIKHILGLVKPHKSKPIMVAEELKLTNHPIFKNIKKVFRIGVVNTHQWFIQYRRDINTDKYISNNGHWKIVETEITDINVIKLYYYLVGRLSGTEDIVDDNVEIKESSINMTPLLSQVLHPFFREHFMI